MSEKSENDQSISVITTARQRGGNVIVQWTDMDNVHICPPCQLQISTMGMLMRWVFLPIGDRNELLLFPGPGWNVFLCWTTKNSQQWFHILTKMIRIGLKGALNLMSFQAELHLGHTILSCLGMSYVFEVIFTIFRSLFHRGPSEYHIPVVFR